MIEPKLKLSDIHWLMNVSDSRNGIVVDGKTGEAMARIEKTMSRFEEMGLDEQRSLWIRVDRGPIDDWGDYDEMLAEELVRDYDDFVAQWKEDLTEDRLWFKITIARFESKLFLHISDGDLHSVMLRTIDPDDYESYMIDLSKKVNALADEVERYAETVGEGYAEWLEASLPYSKRIGYISRAKLCEIQKENWLAKFDRQKLVSILQTPAQPLDGAMTLRKYIEMWCKCWRSVNEPCDLADIDLFMRHNSKGLEIKGLDLDDPTDFDRWDNENSMFHCHDVVYARIPLGCRTGKFTLGTRSYWNLDDLLNIALALDAQNIRPEYYNLDDIIPILKLEDKVEITPYAYRYMQGNGVGSQSCLHEFDEEEQQAIVAETAWEPLAAPVMKK